MRRGHGGDRRRGPARGPADGCAGGPRGERLVALTGAIPVFLVFNIDLVIFTVFNCVFVFFVSEFNNVLIDASDRRGDLPTGVPVVREESARAPSRVLCR